jgi:hypothetical protein
MEKPGAIVLFVLARQGLSDFKRDHLFGAGLQESVEAQENKNAPTSKSGHFYSDD